MCLGCPIIHNGWRDFWACLSAVDGFVRIDLEEFSLGRDLRKYAQQTNIRLILGGLLLVFLVGDGLIYLFLGRNAAIMGFICLLIGLMPLVLTWLFLLLLDWTVKRAQ